MAVEKSKAELQREQINVTTNETAVKEAVEGETEGETEVEAEAETEEAEVEASAETETEETEEHEDTPEEKAAKIEAKHAKERQEHRSDIDKLIADKKATEERAIAAEAKLVAEGKTGLSEDDVKREAERIAAQTVAEKDFVNACNKLAADAKKIDTKFDEKIKVMAEEVGNIPAVGIAILEDLDNGGAILVHLSDNPDEAERIFALSDRPTKMALELSKLSNKLSVKKVKEVSKVPAPNEPLNGTHKGATQLHSKMTDKEWIETREANLREKRAAKRAAMQN
jgi:hypothetical protein